MEENNRYIVADEHGVKRVGCTRISLDSVVIAFQQGQSSEEIQRNFPAMSLEQVYGAIMYYLANREEVEGYLRGQAETWERVREESERRPSAAVERLRKVREEKAGTPFLANM